MKIRNISIPEPEADTLDIVYFVSRYVEELGKAAEEDCFIFGVPDTSCSFYLSLTLKKPMLNVNGLHPNEVNKFM